MDGLRDINGIFPAKTQQALANLLSVKTWMDTFNGKMWLK